MEEIIINIEKLLPKGWSYLIEVNNYNGIHRIWLSISKGEEVKESKKADSYYWALRDVEIYLKSI